MTLKLCMSNVWPDISIYITNDSMSVMWTNSFREGQQIHTHISVKDIIAHHHTPQMLWHATIAHLKIYILFMTCGKRMSGKIFLSRPASLIFLMILTDCNFGLSSSSPTTAISEQIYLFYWKCTGTLKECHRQHFITFQQLFRKWQPIILPQ